MILSITVVCIGTFLCYRGNRSGDNTDFIGRMICLAWPIGIKLLALTVVIGLAIGPVVYLTYSVGTTLDFSLNQIREVVSVEEVVCRRAFGILNFWLLYKYVKLVAHPNGIA